MKRNKRKGLRPDEPLLHPDHRRPITRREFISQGLMTGAAVVTGPTLFGLFANPHEARAALSADISSLKTSCGIATAGAGKIPFICFDLAGGANMSGSNVLVGLNGGQLDFLTTAGYSKLGMPGDMVPGVADRRRRHGFREHVAGPGVPLRQRLPARHSGTGVRRHRGRHQRRRHPGAFGQRHRQQPAQPHVRHRQGRCGRCVADADRSAATPIPAATPWHRRT